MSETIEKPLAGTAPSPGPYAAHKFLAASHGAHLIEDANGEIIGWATDAAGHTTEDVPPDRRDPARIAANAKLFALAHRMLGVCRLVCQAAPLTRARLDRAHLSPHQELLTAEGEALAVLTLMGER